MTERRGQFHQLSTSNFCTRRSPKRKKRLPTRLFFALLGSALTRAARRTLMKLTQVEKSKTRVMHQAIFNPSHLNQIGVHPFPSINSFSLDTSFYSTVHKLLFSQFYWKTSSLLSLDCFFSSHLKKLYFPRW